MPNAPMSFSTVVFSPINGVNIRVKIISWSTVVRCLCRMFYLSRWRIEHKEYNNAQSIISSEAYASFFLSSKPICVWALYNKCTCSSQQWWKSQQRSTENVMRLPIDHYWKFPHSAALMRRAVRPCSPVSGILNVANKGQWQYYFLQISRASYSCLFFSSTIRRAILFFDIDKSSHTFSKALSVARRHQSALRGLTKSKSAFCPDCAPPLARSP